MKEAPNSNATGSLKTLIAVPYQLAYAEGQPSGEILAWGLGSYLQVLVRRQQCKLVRRCCIQVVGVHGVRGAQEAARLVNHTIPQGATHAACM